MQKQTLGKGESRKIILHGKLCQKYLYNKLLALHNPSSNCYRWYQGCFIGSQYTYTSYYFTGALKTRDWKTRNWKTRHQITGVENAGP